MRENSQVKVVRTRSTLLFGIALAVGVVSVVLLLWQSPRLEDSDLLNEDAMHLPRRIKIASTKPPPNSTGTNTSKIKISSLKSPSKSTRTNGSKTKRSPLKSPATSTEISTNPSRFQYHMDPEDEDGFGACLLTMEDNHYLIEWLAYHYHFLPLRRLIIAIDPASRTSPQSILDRYENLIDITVLNDTILFQDKKKFPIPVDKVVRHRLRQALLVSKCLKQMNAENRTWVAMVDTDEYIAIHSKAKGDYKVSDPKPTLYQTIQSPKNLTPRITPNSSCISLRRPQMGIRTIPHDYTIHSTTWNASQFNTLSFRERNQYFKRGQKQATMSGKTLVDASRLDPEHDLDPRRVSAHKPSMTCPPPASRVRPEKATYIAHHYPGTLPQYTFRDDPRKNVRSLDRYYELNFTRNDLTNSRTIHETNDLPNTWVEDFVNKVGHDLAQELLEGIGTVEELSFDSQNSPSSKPPMMRRYSKIPTR